MHHSDDPARRSMICYCDDSGSHEECPVAVVGSILLNKEQFINLDAKWNKLLDEFKLESIHMKDFVRPDGRYSTMPREMKLSLFTSIARQIILNRLYSVSILVPQSDLKTLLSPDIYRHVMGPYSMAFFATMLLNGTIAHATHYGGRISYLVDKGSKHHHLQIDAAHTVVLELESHAEKTSRYIGSLTFDLDNNNNALQAADVIAWAYRRRKEIVPFGDDFFAITANI
jgi:hypothetical protein